MPKIHNTSTGDKAGIEIDEASAGALTGAQAGGEAGATPAQVAEALTGALTGDEAGTGEHIADLDEAGAAAEFERKAKEAQDKANREAQALAQATKDAQAKLEAQAIADLQATFKDVLPDLVALANDETDDEREAREMREALAKLDAKAKASREAKRLEALAPALAIYLPTLKEAEDKVANYEALIGEARATLARVRKADPRLLGLKAGVAPVSASVSAPKGDAQAGDEAGDKVDVEGVKAMIFTAQVAQGFIGDPNILLGTLTGKARVPQVKAITLIEGVTYRLDVTCRERDGGFYANKALKNILGATYNTMNVPVREKASA